MEQYLENNRAALGVNDNVTDFSEYIEVKGSCGTWQSSNNSLRLNNKLATSNLHRREVLNLISFFQTYFDELGIMNIECVAPPR